MKCESNARGGRKPAEPVAAGEKVAGCSRQRITWIMESVRPFRKGHRDGYRSLREPGPRVLGERRLNVSVYLLLSSLTPHGRETLHANPERIDGVNAEMERSGCQVLVQYALLGQYDFATLVEAPNNETVASMSIELGSRGTLNIVTLPAISIDSFEAKLKSSQQQLSTKAVDHGQHHAGSDYPERL
jgi:uncharacterized protein with GYD domain